MRNYGTETLSQQFFHPQTDKVIEPGAEVTGEWSSVQVSGTILSIEMNINGTVTDKTADMGGIEFTGLITAGFGNKITAIQMTSGTAILYL